MIDIDTSVDVEENVVRAGGKASYTRRPDRKNPEKTFLPGIHLFAEERYEAGEIIERDDEFYFLSFRLSDNFIKPYKTKTPSFGFPIGGGNTLGEYVWFTKYSRKKLDGTKERFWEGCRRVIEGMYSIQKDHAFYYRLPWDEKKAIVSAQEAYDRLFSFKWTPPGRGFWMMGTFLVNGLKTSAPLQNCAMLSTKIKDPLDPAFPFYRLMEMATLGVGVGFDTLGAGQVTLHAPLEGEHQKVVIDDSREGWADSTRLLLESYFLPDKPVIDFDYSEIRPAGAPIKRFGGTAAGPEPLIQFHERVRNLFKDRKGDLLSTSDIVDIQNMIGKCVVAANVRSSAEIALGDISDSEFLHLKDPYLHPVRMGFQEGPNGGPLTDADGNWIPTEQGGWGYTSNNSVFVNVGDDYSALSEGIVLNGEPGLVWLDVSRKYGRLIDPPDGRDYRVAGVNPCAEMLLESSECCTLSETYPTKCEDLDDYLRTLKFAYLYGKTVTLLPTHWPETNEVMIRNRRIGLSMTGLAEFVENKGWHELKKWQDAGYREVRRWDKIYSEWLGIRESIKVTTTKPSGSVSLLAGVTPGCHWPKERGFYLRRVRESVNNPIAKAMEEAGYHVEPNLQNPQFGLVVTCPTEGPDIRPEADVSLWEKVSLAAQTQEWWSDNSVSVTATFDIGKESDQIGAVLRSFDGRLKSISFLGTSGGNYAQLPYEKVPVEEWSALRSRVRPLNWDLLYASDAADAEGERYCSNDSCTLE